MDLGCVNCHAIGGAGGQVGPDLVSIGASAPVDYLVESILQPNKAIKEGYHSLVVEARSLPRTLKVSARTKDGIVMALRHVKLPVFGVQFHPESILTLEGKKLIGNFLRM